MLKLLRKLFHRSRRKRVVGCSLIEAIRLQEATPPIIEKFESGAVKFERHMLPVVKKGKKR